MAPARRSRNVRRQTAGFFHHVEQLFYGAVAVALAVAGAILFGHAIYRFAAGVPDEPVEALALGFLDTLLLVFIVTELLHTVRAVIHENVLLTEPFLIVGIVAAIRRLIVISAEASELAGTARFDDLMLESGILLAAVLALGITIFLLRHTERSEPTPAHEPEPDRSGAPARAPGEGES